MAFRGGRGGGRGFGRGFMRFPKPESFKLFPEDVELPEKSKVSEEELKLLQLSRKLHIYFQTSPYFLEEGSSESNENFEIETKSNKAKRTNGSSRESLLGSGYLILEPWNFPVELIRGTKHKAGKKVQWNAKQDLKKLDFLEQLEEKHKDQVPRSKKGNEHENEEEDEEEENMEEEEESDEGDYGQGEDYDDDEDDYNMGDDGDDEAIM